MDNEAFDDYLCWYAHHEPANLWSEKEETAAEAAWGAAYVRAGKICQLKIDRLTAELKETKARVATLERENSWLESHGVTK